jgi:hypothetical protein
MTVRRVHHKHAGKQVEIINQTWQQKEKDKNFQLKTRDCQVKFYVFFYFPSYYFTVVVTHNRLHA